MGFLCFFLLWQSFLVWNLSCSFSHPAFKWKNELISFSQTVQYVFLFFFNIIQSRHRTVHLIRRKETGDREKADWGGWRESRPTSTCTAAAFFSLSLCKQCMQKWDGKTFPRSLCIIQPHGGFFLSSAPVTWQYEPRMKWWDEAGRWAGWRRLKFTQRRAQQQKQPPGAQLPLRQLLRDFQLFHFP